MDPAQPGQPEGVHVVSPSVTSLDHPEERDALAAEFVLGTLAEPDRAAVAAALAQDTALRAAVYAWQDLLLPMSARSAPAEPAPQSWQRIELAINNVAARAAAGPADAPAQRPRPAKAPWWQRLAWLQGLSAGAVAVSLMLGVLLLQRLSAPDAADAVRYVAVLQSPADQSNGWLVELRADRLRLVPTADTGAVPTGRALQFWTKLPGAAGPVSLGLVQAGQTVELPLSQLPGAGPQQLFEITLEPAGGSPLGRPSGPILYVGRTVAL